MTGQSLLGSGRDQNRLWADFSHKWDQGSWQRAHSTLSGFVLSSSWLAVLGGNSTGQVGRAGPSPKPGLKSVAVNPPHSFHSGLFA